MSPKKKVNKDQKTKEEVSKTTQTAPTPSESTPIFVKRIVTDYFYSPTKPNMSSKDWSEMSKQVDSLLSGEHNEDISINF